MFRVKSYLNKNDVDRWAPDLTFYRTRRTEDMLGKSYVMFFFLHEHCYIRIEDLDVLLRGRNNAILRTKITSDFSTFRVDVYLRQ